ncbi:unnamed protein product [Nesidiocoris tenuis]|uniref:Uncharacterized protein n=1 Tax=Nesidiocoris tenuis TaxID=355587 RepID=A0A6H5GDS8_9HEMI|nr:unnamed protein product [Nesidiocoris tenuis]CAB0001072.1 unnamed protein product [Nesidiocoris tenuis]
MTYLFEANTSSWRKMFLNSILDIKPLKNWTFLCTIQTVAEAFEQQLNYSSNWRTLQTPNTSNRLTGISRIDREGLLGAGKTTRRGGGRSGDAWSLTGPLFFLYEAQAQIEPARRCRGASPPPSRDGLSVKWGPARFHTAALRSQTRNFSLFHTHRQIGDRQ